MTAQNPDNRPSGTCVDAGAAQFDQQTCEPVNPRPQPERLRSRAHDDVVCELIDAGFTPSQAEALASLFASK